MTCQRAILLDRNETNYPSARSLTTRIVGSLAMISSELPRQTSRESASAKKRSRKWAIDWTFQSSRGCAFGTAVFPSGALI